MEQTVVTQPKRLQPKKPRRRITPVTVCQAIHDVPYIVARALIRAVRAVGHCFAWTWDAIASDVRANWRAFCCGRLVTGCRDALRSPALREVHHIMRDHPSIRAITMIAVTAVIFAAAVMAEPVRTMDAICIVVDGDGPHVLDERSEERTYDDLLLRRSLGDKSMQLLLEPGRTVTITHGDDTHTLTTEAERLSSLLRRSGIRLGEDEMVELNVAGEDPVIRISDTLTYQHYVTVETDYKILRSPDPLMDKGTEEIIRKGIPGQIVETYEDTVVSGEVVSTKYIGASHDTSHAELVRYGTRVYEVEEGDTIEKDFPNEVGEGGYLLFASGDTMTAEETEKLEALKGYKQKFIDAMDDDLNTADALSAIFELTREINAYNGSHQDATKAFLTAAHDLFMELTGVLNLVQNRDDAADPDAEKIEELIAQRAAAKKEKNFAEADRIRGVLADMGVTIKDTRQGTQWSRN